MTLRRLAAAVVLLDVAAACFKPVVGGTRPPTSGPVVARGRPNGPPGRDSVVANVMPSNKVVNGKEEPQTLIAIDGSRCTVTVEKFREVTYGDRVFCAWREGRSDR